MDDIDKIADDKVEEAEVKCVDFQMQQEINWKIQQKLLMGNRDSQQKARIDALKANGTYYHNKIGNTLSSQLPGLGGIRRLSIKNSLQGGLQKLKTNVRSTM